MKAGEWNPTEESCINPEEKTSVEWNAARAESRKAIQKHFTHWNTGCRELGLGFLIGELLGYFLPFLILSSDVASCILMPPLCHQNSCHKILQNLQNTPFITGGFNEHALSHWWPCWGRFRRYGRSGGSTSLGEVLRFQSHIAFPVHSLFHPYSSRCELLACCFSHHVWCLLPCFLIMTVMDSSPSRTICQRKPSCRNLPWPWQVLSQKQKHN